MYKQSLKKATSYNSQKLLPKSVCYKDIRLGSTVYVRASTCTAHANRQDMYRYSYSVRKASLDSRPQGRENKGLGSRLKKDSPLCSVISPCMANPISACLRRALDRFSSPWSCSVIISCCSRRISSIDSRWAAPGAPPSHGSVLPPFGVFVDQPVRRDLLNCSYL